MKSIAFLIICWFLGSTVMYGQLVPAAVHTSTADKRIVTSSRDAFSGRSTTTIVRDTILYPYAKRTSNRGIFINPVSSAGAVGQVYDINASVNIAGFEFFAYIANSSVTTPIDLICSIYPIAGGIPSGQPYATTTVSVRANTITTLGANRLVARFVNPVTVNGPFALVVENPIDENVSLFSSNWDNGDGLSEYLPTLFIGGNWLNAASVNVGGAAFDADFFIHPFVSYSFDYGFSLSQRCLDGNDTIDFVDETAKAYLQNRFINRAIFDRVPTNRLIKYDFSNGQGTVFREDTTVIYAQPQKYVIRQDIEHNLWSNERPFIFRDSIDIPPVAEFSFNQKNYRVNFINTSTGVDDVTWSFGDSMYATLLNPAYRYLQTGTYDVVMVVKNGCGTDTATAQITISPNGIDDAAAFGWTAAPNPTASHVMLNWSTIQPVDGVRLLDLQGRLLAEWKINRGVQQWPVDLTKYAQGLYFLQLYDEAGHTAVIKVTRMR